MSEVRVIGLTLAMHVFQVHEADASGQIVVRKGSDAVDARDGLCVPRWVA